MRRTTTSKGTARSEREQWPWHRLTVRVDGESYVVTLSEGPSNWSAHVARLPGLVVTGAYSNGTLDHGKVRRKLAEGIQFHLEGLAIEVAERAAPNRLPQPNAG